MAKQPASYNTAFWNAVEATARQADRHPEWKKLVPLRDGYEIIREVINDFDRRTGARLAPKVVGKSDEGRDG